MKQFQISSEEKLQLENSVLKIDNANLIIQSERTKQDMLINQICQRLDIKREDITGFDIQMGIITVKDAVDTKEENQ